MRGLSTGGNLRFKIDWASLIAGRKFIVFALFNFVFESNFPSTSPRGVLYSLMKGKKCTKAVPKDNPGNIGYEPD